MFIEISEQAAGKSKRLLVGKLPATRYMDKRSEKDGEIKCL